MTPVSKVFQSRNAKDHVQRFEALIHFNSKERSSTNIPLKFSFCVLLKTESPTGLQVHEGIQEVDSS
ncbi:hypothetical protein QQF64_014408 [Cirrhinus molitorella]|uniref:Uncharacterized protein n=1 Tax=Cirrhinus molitorella TaxID=172907 RepID=A0ABR3NS13_9TELE